MEMADPSYPLYPIACILASLMLILVLMTNLVRQKWNLGVAFLCFWLFFDNLTSAIDTIIWSNNADLKLYVYCDIGMSVYVPQSHIIDYLFAIPVSHLGQFTSVATPMATLIITRRLYLIARLQSVELPGQAAVCIIGCTRCFC